MTVEVALLADTPQLIPLLTEWFYTEWGQNDPPFTRKEFQRQFRERLNRDRVPLTMVAFLDGSPVATASLKIREMDPFPQFEHWLGGVYTLPEYRRQGIGSHVVEACVAQASRLGVGELYLYTRRSTDLYAGLGWETIARPSYRGKEVVIMKRRLPAHRES
jgi:GNAT superfamily N-acetyltransferase